MAVRKNTEDYRHSRFISDQITIMKPGEKKIIKMPPRGGKSLIVSEGGPAWALANDPNNQVGHATYGHDFTVTFGRQVRRYIKENSGLLTPRLDPSAKAIDSFFIHPDDGTGFYFADGVDGGFVGRGFNWLFLDDLIKNAKEAMSVVVRENTWQWIIRVALQRLEPDARVVGVGTQWHEDDWIGRAEMSDEWEVINIPALAEEDDVLGREVGEALNPERFTAEDFEKIKRRDSLVFAAMYQGHPTPEDGDVFKKPTLRYYKELPPVEKWGARFATVDLAHSKKQRADFSVVSVWMVTKPPFPRLYWIAMFRDKVSSGDHDDWVHGNLAGVPKDLQPRYIVVGNKTFGSSLMDAARKHPKPGRPFYKPQEEETDKRTRAQPAAAIAAQGMLWLPEDAPWLPEAIHEMMLFDNGAHDDIVDTLSMAALEFNGQPWVRAEKKKFEVPTVEQKAAAQIKRMQKKTGLTQLRKRLMR